MFLMMLLGVVNVEWLDNFVIYDLLSYNSGEKNIQPFLYQGSDDASIEDLLQMFYKVL